MTKIYISVKCWNFIFYILPYAFIACLDIRLFTECILHAKHLPKDYRSSKQNKIPANEEITFWFGSINPTVLTASLKFMSPLLHQNISPKTAQINFHICAL
jgi:hypothetical protein